MRFDATIPMFALCMTASCVLRTPSFTPSLSASALPSSMPSSSPSPGEEGGAGGIIEAGCTFTGEGIKSEPGSPRQLTCPAGCKKDVDVFGTDVYTSGSPVCAAAMHAGVMSAHGGEVTVVVEAGRPAYRGSKRNGVASRDFGTNSGSFRFQGPLVVKPEPAVVHATVLVDAGCTFEGSQVHGEPGSIHRVSCPSGCKADHGVWGTDTYSGHSRVCLAAIHAGLSSDDGGGEFTLILGDARPAFRGSKRNGVQSGDWGDYNVSFRLQR
jgi:hypothetical protein